MPYSSFPICLNCHQVYGRFGDPSGLCRRCAADFESEISGIFDDPVNPAQVRDQIQAGQRASAEKSRADLERKRQRDRDRDRERRAKLKMMKAEEAVKRAEAEAEKQKRLESLWADKITGEDEF